MMLDDKPCPFCGAAARRKQRDESRVHASCSNSECWQSDHWMPVSAWNQRKTEAPVVEEEACFGTLLRRPSVAWADDLSNRMAADDD